MNQQRPEFQEVLTGIRKDLDRYGESHTNRWSESNESLRAEVMRADRLPWVLRWFRRFFGGGRFHIERKRAWLCYQELCVLLEALQGPNPDIGQCRLWWEAKTESGWSLAQQVLRVSYWSRLRTTVRAVEKALRVFFSSSSVVVSAFKVEETARVPSVSSPTAVRVNGVSSLSFEEEFKVFKGLCAQEDLDKGEISQAFRKLAVRYHPDKNPNGAEQYKQFSACYQKYLECLETRLSYDPLTGKWVEQERREFDMGKALKELNRAISANEVKLAEVGVAIAQMKKETKEGIAQLRAGVKEGVAQLRAGVKEGVAQAEVKIAQADVKIAQARTEAKQGLAKLYRKLGIEPDASSEEEEAVPGPRP